MQTISEIRLQNLRLLVEEFGSQEHVAEAADTAAVYLSQLLNSAADSKTGKPRVIGNDLARKLEVGCKKPTGWMDNVHYPPGSRQAKLAAAIGLMENMPEYQLNQAIKIIDALAQPELKTGTSGTI